MLSRLPAYSNSVRVSPEAARFDLIQLLIGDWVVAGSVENIGAFFDLLGPCPPDGRHPTNVILATNIERLTPADYGWMFNRPAGSMDKIRSLSFRSRVRRHETTAGAPLVAGRLQIKPASSSGFGGVREITAKRLHLDVSLNLTRYLMHQLFPTQLARAWQDWELPEPNVRTLAHPPGAAPAKMYLGGELETEIPLTHEDNVLLGVRRHSLGRPGTRSLHLRRYILKLEAAVSEEFRRAHTSAGLSIDRPNGPRRDRTHYNLKKVETYFEFFDENATRRVRLLDPLLAPIGLRNTSRRYPDGLSETAVRENRVTVRITLGSGRELRVYAKTTKRIRFELIHELDDPSVNALLQTGGNRKTTDDIDELLGWFELLAADAAECVNSVLAEIEEYLQPPQETPATVYELLTAIYSTVHDPVRAEAIIGLLVENGYVRVGKSPAPFLEGIRQLRRKGVLQHIGGSERVTARYRDALDSLRRDAAAGFDEETSS